MTTARSRAGRRSTRRGAALVEMAICLPLLVTVLLTAMETADVIYLKQTLHIAGYETARMAIKPKSTTSGATAVGDQFLSQRGVKAYQISIEPADVAQVAKGDPITVTVTALVRRNTVLPDWALGTNRLTAEVRMNKE